jgi:predicted dehydrogenase
MRWHRLVREARDIVRSGRLGTLQAIRAVWNSPRDDDTLPEWRRHRALGGGALVEVAMDHVDLWRYLLESEIDEIFALSVDARWEDEAAVLSGRMANGVLISAVLSERTNHDLEIEISGKAGRLRVSCIRFEGLEFYATHAMPSAPWARLGRLAHFVRQLSRALPRMHRAGDYRLSYRDQWRHFHECVRLGVPAASTLEDGRQALAVVLAAAESAVAGRPVGVRQAALI